MLVFVFGEIDDLVFFAALQNCQKTHLSSQVSHFENGEKSNHLRVSSIICLLRYLYHPGFLEPLNNPNDISSY